MPGEAWTPEQRDSLLRQVIVERKALPQLRVAGRTPAAINNERRRLKEAGVLRNSFAGRRHVSWTMHELRQLTRLTCEHGFSAAFIAQLQLIPGRSQHAVSKMMGRHGLGDPAVKTRARQAQRLTPERRRELESFLRHEGRFWSSAAVARQWGLADQTVNTHRRRLGLALSWQEARASDPYQQGQQRRGHEFSEQLRNRWQEWRLGREQRLHALKHRLEQSVGAPPERVCERCCEQWFATRDFFHVATRQRSKSSGVSMSRTCRLCRAAHRRERKAPQLQAARTLTA